MMLFADALFGLPTWIDAIVRVVLVVLAMTVVVMYLTYGERKVVARFQQRLGPTPFAADWGVRDLALGMFYVFAILGLNIVGIMMAGLGSGNKYALLGGIRAAAQMVSYEIPLVLSLLCVAMITGADLDGKTGTLNLNAIAALQENRPYIVLQPLAFLIFFTAMLSELHRAPFDIPVAESEIVGGYFVEYSGIRWSMVQLTEYASVWGWPGSGGGCSLAGGPGRSALTRTGASSWPPPW